MVSALGNKEYLQKKIAMENYFVFTDEAGQYEQEKSAKFLLRHPFYIRANIIIKIDDYFDFCNKIKVLNKKMNIPIGEEIKWQDLWDKKRNRNRKPFLARMSFDDVEKYIVSFLDMFAIYKEASLVVSVTSNTRIKKYKKENLIGMHLQVAYQRVQNEIGRKGTAIFIMDELDNTFTNKLKESGFFLISNGDNFVQYNNIFPNLLIDHSNHCIGLQLADFCAGATNGVLKKELLGKSTFNFSEHVYKLVILPKLRSNHTGYETLGYGIVEVPQSQSFRKDLQKIDIPSYYTADEWLDL